jgi:hypothetical protein
MTGPWPDREDEIETAERLMAFLACGHLTGQPLPDHHIWTFVGQWWECFRDHLAELYFRWCCVDPADVVAHLVGCAPELGALLRIERGAA